ncbi:Belongs to the glycosyl hydrolase 18 [Homalodisca vitripennis]|nr:Belongs to the glycosyl hydrolase 18 [Homalodisca vitripennis]
MSQIDTVKYYIDELQCPSHKIVLGIPFYGHTYTMVDTSPAQFGVPVSGPGTVGTYTKSTGIQTYYEICLLIKYGYSSGHSQVNGSYAWNGTQFISYDGPIDIIRKSRLIMDYELKGAMLWNLAYDDFNNTCGGGRYPLLTALNQQLRFCNSSGVAC